MSFLLDLAKEMPDDARRILREAYALNDCSIVATARAMGVSLSTIVFVRGQLGLEEEFRAAYAALWNRFRPPVEVRHSRGRHAANR